MPQEDGVNHSLVFFRFTTTSLQLLKSYQAADAGREVQNRYSRFVASGTFVLLGGLVAGESQWTNQEPLLDRRAAGFGRCILVAAYGDLVIGNYMTRGHLPNDSPRRPIRYFRRGTGSAWSRLRYAVGHTFWTQRDRGGMEFNFSEIAGASATVAISNRVHTRIGGRRRDAAEQIRRFE